MDNYLIKIAFRRHASLWKLVGINIAVALACWLTRGADALTGSSFDLVLWLTLAGDFHLTLIHPWTLFSYMVTQTEPLHLLFNMLWLFWVGIVLEDVVGARGVMKSYLVGGLAGGILFLLAVFFFPGLKSSSLSGASAAAICIMVEATLHQPNREFNLFLLGNVKLKWIAIVVLVFALLLPAGEYTGGEVAHLGGTLAGFLLYYKGRLSQVLKKLLKPETRNAKRVVEAFQKHKFDTERRSDLERLDDLLEKIRISGYDSLTKMEKRELKKISDKR